MEKKGKTTATPVAAVKAPEVKATPVVETKAAPVAKAAETKAPATKAAGTKTATKKVAEKKPAAKKTTTKAVKKVELKSEVHIQFAGKSYTEADLLKIAKDVWKYDLKQKVGDLKSCDLYVKPEENMAYYVMNGEFNGSFAI